MLSEEKGAKRSPSSLPTAWRVVFINFLLMALVFNGIFTTPGLFIPSLTEFFGISRTQASLAMTFTMLTGIAGNLIAGRILSRRSVRAVVSVMLLINALTFFGNASASSIRFIYLMSLLRGICAPFLHLIPISIQINRFFTKQNRGRAMSFSMIGSGVAALILNPATGLIIKTYGWRGGYLFWGTLSLLMVLPVWFVYGGAPQKKLQSVDSALEINGDQISGEKKGLTVPQALKSPLFWVATSAVFLAAGCTQNWNYNGGAFLFDLDYDQVMLSGIMSLTSLGTMAGKLVLGFVCDRFGTKKGAVFVMVSLAAGYGLGVAALIFRREIVLVSAFLMGIGFTMITVILPLYAGDLFGDREYGTLLGFLQTGMNMGNTTLPLAGILLYEASKSYLPTWTLFGSMSLAVLILLLFSYALHSARSPG